ncbi:MAG: hypothetical protein ACLQVK_08115 [Acidimicrobiales bacterium]
MAGRLGPADASVTLRVYAHALEARDRDMVQVLSCAVLGTAAYSGDDATNFAVEPAIRSGHP